jgi:uncharacterized iron-regulated protein
MKLFESGVLSIFAAMKKQMLILVAALACLSFTADKPAYMLFNAKGKSVKYAKMLDALAGADVILFGEYHDNPIVHWLQREVTGDLYAMFGKSLILGAEMFEADNQLLLDEYLGGLITEAKFEDEARLWNNYKTDYKPLLKFAVDHRLRFIATNVPRRYANLVYRKGFEALDSLSSEAKRYLPPLPPAYDPELPGYKKMLEMGHQEMGHGMENFPKAQAIKDATMAYFILQNLGEAGIFLHFNGAGHSDNYEGIVWYLLREKPDLNIITVTTLLQESPEKLDEESSGRADFSIVVPQGMTRTY